jgi:hypothetical protein
MQNEAYAASCLLLFPLTGALSFRKVSEISKSFRL